MKILAIQNRMGIGDMVIFLPFIEAIAKKYKTPITLLIKENSKAREYTKNLQFIKKIIYLKRDSKNDLHNGLSGFLNLKNEIKKGVVTKKIVHSRICEEYKDWFKNFCFTKLIGLTESPIKGPKGNTEFLICSEKTKNILNSDQQ